MFDSLDHVILRVRDLAEATRRYAVLFGRRPSWHGEHPSEGTANTLFRLGNTYLELLAPEGDGPTARLLSARLASVGEGPVGLALATADVASAHAQLAARGLEPMPIASGIGRDRDSGLIRRWRTAMLPTTRTRGVLLFAIEHLTPDLLPDAAPVGPHDAVVTGIDHAVLRTADADGAIALYRDALGLRLALDKSFPDWGMRLVFVRVGGVTIEIAQPLTGGEQPAGVDKLWGLSWRVPDAQAARARLADAGLDVSPVRPGRKPGTRVLSVKDGTCGVPTLLIEPAPTA